MRKSFFQRLPFVHRQELNRFKYQKLSTNFFKTFHIQKYNYLAFLKYFNHFIMMCKII